MAERSFDSFPLSFTFVEKYVHLNVGYIFASYNHTGNPPPTLRPNLVRPHLVTCVDLLHSLPVLLVYFAEYRHHNHNPLVSIATHSCRFDNDCSLPPETKAPTLIQPHRPLPSIGTNPSFRPTRLLITMTSTLKLTDIPPCMRMSFDFPWESSPEKEIVSFGVPSPY